jgi:DNA helicase-2/ATP-dependent DNA helicase PcrA
MFELNDQQRAAVEHRGGPLLVLAGAGTGKTGTLACRLAQLISDGAEPSRICLLTFTRRAAIEMLARAGRMTDQRRATAQVWGGTFHAVANRVLRLHGRRLGLDPGFTVMDQSDAAELIGLVRSEIRSEHHEGRRFPRPETLTAIYTRVVNTEEPLATVLARDFPWCAEEAEEIRAIFVGYTARKRRQHMLDFDDLLLCWRALLALPGGAAMWDHVLVDEYQDTNALQADILAALRPGGDGLTVVGDDAQAIYAFRAATNRNILDFPQRFTGATVVRLERNYRSTTPILSVANAIMAQVPAGAGYAKQLWSERPGRRRPLLRTCEDEGAQADAVCASVLAHREAGVLLQQQAVLFRASHHADLLELALTERNIPYVKYGGLKFLEAAHVKDLTSLLRLLDNPWDELAWFRVLQLLEGVGQATARRLMASLGVGIGVGVGDVVDPAVTPVARLLAAAPSVPTSAAGEFGALRTALASCASEPVPPPGAQVERLRRWLGPIIERRYTAAAARMADLEQLEQVAGRYGSRTQYLAELTLDPPASTGDLAGPPSLDEDWLVLSTVHSAKGGEWEVVHVVHAADGMFPSDMATGDVDGIEEERRLLYVAVTRARSALEINVPLRYHFQRGPGRHSDGHSYAQVSRFLTSEVRALMDSEQVGAPVAAEDAVAARAGGMGAVDSFLAGLWS